MYNINGWDDDDTYIKARVNIGKTLTIILTNRVASQFVVWYILTNILSRWYSLTNILGRVGSQFVVRYNLTKILSSDVEIT